MEKVLLSKGAFRGPSSQTRPRHGSSPQRLGSSAEIPLGMLARCFPNRDSRDWLNRICHVTQLLKFKGKY